MHSSLIVLLPPITFLSSIASLSFERDQELNGYPSTRGGICANSATDAFSSSVNFGWGLPGFLGLIASRPLSLKARISSLMWYSLSSVSFATSWTVIPWAEQRMT